ncbi:hypothetical protein, partial [Paludifilum halophilum]|uniref:hypothetical protein n=1 Tax=Paludifilum halophilum TaxID=1642702 RepID=UPI001F0A16BC
HMQMHHLHARHEVHSPTYNKWLDINAPYVRTTMEAKDVTMHVLAQSPCEDAKYLLLLLIWVSLYDPKCYEVLNLVVTSPISQENIA